MPPKGDGQCCRQRNRRSNSEQRRAIYAVLNDAKWTSDDCRVGGEKRRPALIAAQQTSEKPSINSDCESTTQQSTESELVVPFQLRMRQCIRPAGIAEKGEPFAKEISNGQRHIIRPGRVPCSQAKRWVHAKYGPIESLLSTDKRNHCNI